MFKGSIYIKYHFRQIFFWPANKTLLLQGLLKNNFVDRGKRCIFVLPNGALAERLGAGLQNLSQWFDSATHLRNALQIAEGHLFYLWGIIMQNRWRVAFGGIEARLGWC